MSDALCALLALPKPEQEARGLLDTPREIKQQPDTWLDTFKTLTAHRAGLRGFLDESGLANGAAPPAVILAGAGTSDYIGNAIYRLLHRHWRCDVAAVPSTELLTNMGEVILPDRQYLCISFSRSGDSSEGVAVLEQALELYPRQVRHLLVTCNRNGAMVRNFAQQSGVAAIVLGDEVNDRGLAMTSSFSNMIITGQYLACIRDPHRYEQLLHDLAEMGRRLLPNAANMAADLAKKKFSRVCFLGTGALRAVASESALKVLELNAGGIPTIAESPLGLRHGPMSFVNEETLVVAYLSGDELRNGYELDLLEEIARKKLGAEMLIVAPRASKRISHLTRNVLSLEAPLSFPDGYRPPVDVIAGQLLGLFFSIANGITPDSPSTGAISRVVSHVNIYSPAGRKKE